MESGSQATRTRKNKKKLTLVLWLTGIYLLAEVIGGFWTGSLALLADAGHMFTDVGGLALALFAIKMAERPATSEKTYGYYRAEILAALANAVVLIFISFYILFEAYKRFLNPPEVASGIMSVVAVIGLFVNVVGLYILKQGSTDSLNMKGAYFEVLSDLLTSVGVIIAGLIIWTTGWRYADPLVSAGIGLFILPRTWTLIKEAVGVLLEGTPAGVNVAEIRNALLKIDGISGVHDLHVWSLTSGVNALSVHIMKEPSKDSNSVLKIINAMLKDKFAISHTTVQLEDPGFAESKQHL